MSTDKSTTYLIAFKHAYVDEETGDAKKATDCDEFSDLESGQEWIADKMEEWPGAAPEAFTVRASSGIDLAVSITPPQTGYVVVIGEPAGKKGRGRSSADGYKACSKGEDCTGKVEGKPGNAYKIKTGGLCRKDYEASKTPAASTGGNGAVARGRARGSKRAWSHSASSVVSSCAGL